MKHTMSKSDCFISFKKELNENKKTFDEHEYVPISQTIRLVKWKEICMQAIDLICLLVIVVIVFIRHIIMIHCIKQSDL